jgi:hypothetical protein
MAHIVIIGTHKDEVSDRADHERISLTLMANLKNTEAWRRGFVVFNDKAQGVLGRTNLNFFPIDNRLGRRDHVVTDFLDACEHSMLQTAYVKQQVPLTWLKFIDEIGAEKSASLSILEAAAIANSCGIGSEMEVNVLLKFCQQVKKSII